MNATDDILKVWKKFDDFPMETLTKAWFYHKTNMPKQRDVSLMKEHRIQYGVTGNCFDLAIWLLDEFNQNRITAYPIGHDLGTSSAHVAVVAVNENGNRFLCDLGDQWLTPVLIDRNSENFSEEKLLGFFPGAAIQVKTELNNVEVFYHRPNGKMSKQIYSLEPIEIKAFLNAAESSQNYIKKHPLLECRVPFKNEIAHWEFYNWDSFLSTHEGLYKDPKQETIEQWSEVIHKKTGYDKVFVQEALIIYDKLE